MAAGTKRSFRAHWVEELSMPSVSIITPVFNRKDYLAQTIQSVQRQTFQDWEMIIVDDGSTDRVEEMVRENFGNDPRIRFLIRQSPLKGANVCRNEGSRAAFGEWVIYLDSDDLLAPHCLENRVRQMKEHPEIDFCVFYCEIFFETPGDSGIIWNIFNNGDDLDRFINFDIPWGNCSVIWRREAVCRVGLWNESVPSWQDIEFHTRAIVSGLRYLKFENVDCFYRLFTPGSIGKHSVSPQHLASRVYFFKTVNHLLSSAGMMSKTRRKGLARLMAFSAWQCVDYRYRRGALRLWLSGCFLKILKPGDFLKIVLAPLGKSKTPGFSDTFYPFNPEVWKRGRR